MHNTRLLVAKALCKMQRAQSWSNLVLNNMIEEHALDAKDSAFAGALFYGVLERSITLDACIAAHCSVRPKKLSLPVLAALRMGIYQLLYMDSVPDSAAVNESVAAAKAMGQHKSTGLVNAVLRSFLRGEKHIPLPEDPVERLSVEYSCPVPLIRLWIDGYGEDATLRMLTRSLAPPPLYIRVNTLKTDDDPLICELEKLGVQAEKTDLPHCLRLREIGAVTRLAPFREGLFHVQDKSSQLCALSLEAEPGMRVLDACCAPGGKTFVLAQQMNNTGELVAADLHPHRLALVERRGAEMGLSCIQTLAADMTLPQQALGLFDRILCDVPCSGLGVIARKPELKYKELDEFSDLPDLQYKILANTAQYCKAGGLILYSTCTLRHEENRQVVERFLEQHPGFCPAPLPQKGAGETSRTFLGDEDTDGFFMAALRRKSDEDMGERRK